MSKACRLTLALGIILFALCIMVASCSDSQQPENVDTETTASQSVTTIADTWTETESVQKNSKKDILTREYRTLNSEYTGKIEQLIAACEEKGLTCDYEKSDWFIYRRFLSYGRKDLDNEKYYRSEYTLRCLKTLAKDLTERLEEYLRGKKTPLTVSRYVTSDVTLDGMSFIAENDSGERRPTFFVGYGHFSSAQNDVSVFSNIGVNLIQMEIGPSDLVTGINAKGEYILAIDSVTEKLSTVFRKAKENNVGIALLLSPHYVPSWFKDMYPGVMKQGSYYSNAPEMRNMLEVYLRTVMEIVKDEPALHSVIIMNEPTQCYTYESYLPEYRSFLKERFDGRIKNLNEVYGTGYKNFDEIGFPSELQNVLMHPENERYSSLLPQLWDWIAFNDYTFGEQNQWMYDMIRSVAPDVMVSSKIMQNFIVGDEEDKRREFLAYGTDHETLAGILPLNGNDAHSYVREPTCGILNKIIFYDLQTSLLDAPVFDSENHVIHDHYNVYETYSDLINHVASDVWQGAVHGCSADAIWIWERTYDDSGDFAGSILHRPDVLQKTSRAMLDLNRLAYEVTSIQNAKRTVGIFHSTAARVYSTENCCSMTDSYEAATYSGERVRFITEKQTRGGALKETDVQVLIIPYGTHVINGAIEQIAEYIKNGGKVIVIGNDSLMYDEYSLPLDSGIRDYIMNNSTVIDLDGNGKSRTHPSAKEIWEILLRVRSGITDDIPVKLTDHISGEPIYGVDYLSTIYKEKLLINLCGYEYDMIQKVDVRYDGKVIGNMEELISQGTVSGDGLTVRPYEPMLLSVSLDDLP